MCTALRAAWSGRSACAGKAARAAVLPGSESIVALGAAVGTSYAMQLKEGMQPLPDHGQLGAKYCGGGWGGYAVYLFETQQQRDAFCKLPDTTPIEPYIRQQ